MDGSNNKWIVKWLVCALWLLLITIITTIATNVIANDKKNTKTHETIRGEFQKADLKLREKININQEKNNEKLTKILVQQGKILTLLEK